MISLADIFAAVGGLVPLLVIALLVRWLALRRVGNGLKRDLLSILIAWAIATIIASFGAGTGGFSARLQNIPDIQTAASYAISALILAGVILLVTAIRRKVGRNS